MRCLGGAPNRPFLRRSRKVRLPGSAERDISAVSDTERIQPLAGLVSPAAETLFLRLLAQGSIPIGSGPGKVEPHDSAATELLDLGLAFRSGDRDGLLRPVDQTVALRLLIEQRQHEAVLAQRRILDAWSRLTALLPRDVGGGSCGTLDEVIPLANFQEVVTRAAELFSSARQRMRGTETGEFSNRATADRLRIPPRTAISSGARYQMIYQISYLSTAAGAKIVEESAKFGEEVRLRQEVAVKMLHVDDSVALLSTDRLAQTALLIRAPAIVAMLREWFDLLWADPTTIAPGGTAGRALTNGQRRVLELMAVDGDEAIARRLRISITTVRRHVKAIYTALGVDNRFAAGVAAAKRGWV